MQDHQQAWQRGLEERPVAGTDRRVTASGTLGLPNWESFPVADRRRLVDALLQLARRQVEARPASSHQKA
jgi:hypothetical protein